MECEVINLDGLTFIFSPFKNLETASLGVFVKIGSRFEEKEKRGISHFLEHMLFKGTKNYTYRQIKQEIEGRGGLLNGYTAEELCAYYAHFLKKNLEVVLDILLDMVFSPALKKEDIEKEKKVILEEIKMYNDLPSNRAAMLLDKLLWQSHPLGEEIIGDFRTVKNIAQQDLLAFKDRYYRTPFLVVSFSGDYNKEKIIKLLRKRIKGEDSSFSLKLIPPLALKGIHIKIERRQLEQAYLYLGFRAVSAQSKEKIPIELLNIILGANMSSRLFEAIRERKALCYDISSIALKYKDCGAFIIRLGLDKTKIELALKGILKELKKIQEEKIPQKELERAKDYFLGQLAMGLEQVQSRMFYLAHSYLSLEKIYSFNQIREEVESIQSEHLQQLAQRVFSFKDMAVSCLGDLERDAQDKIREVIEKFS